MKKIILLCCFFCFFGFSSTLKGSPLDLINALKEEMSPQNRQFISALVNIEIKKNNKKIEHLNSLLEVNQGGKLLTQIHRKEEIKIEIEKLEKENELLIK